MLSHHRIPEATPEPLSAPAGNEIRYPVRAGGHNTRSHREENT